jgi:hypothetical protein
MKRLFLLFTLITLFVTPVLAIDTCLSGSYYNPETSGTGIDIQVRDDKVVLYRFATLGSAPAWWTGVASNDSDLVLVFPMYQTFQGTTANVGSLTLIPDEFDSTKFYMEWDYIMDLTNVGSTMRWCLIGDCSGAEDIQVLFQPVPCG